MSNFIFKRLDDNPDEARLYTTSKLYKVIAGNEEWTTLEYFQRIANKIYNFMPRSDDTWVMTLPRSGTTWTQEIVWILANDMDIEKAKRSPLPVRFPFIDFDCMRPVEDIKALVTNIAGHNNINIENLPDNVTDYINLLPSPRFVKTHHPFSFIPNLLKSDCKKIYVSRHPKDVMVSWYYFHRSYYNNKDEFISFPEFCRYYMTDKVLYTPYWAHIKQGWAERHRPDFLFLFYEDLKRDLPTEIKKIAKFLGKEYSDTDINKLVNHVSIKNFRNNEMVNAPVPFNFHDISTIRGDDFIRQGRVGGWKDLMTSELNAEVDKWIADNLEDTDIVLPRI